MKIQKRGCLSDDIPQEIVLKILSKLPVKTLISCTIICKDWKSLITNTHLIDTHLQQSSATKLSIIEGVDLSLGSPKLLLLLDGSTIEELELPITITMSDMDIINTRLIVGSCNGLVCLNLSDDHTTIVLWNPATRSARLLPQPMSLITQGSNFNDDDFDNNFNEDSDSDSYELASVACHLSFGFDHINNDYKLVRITENTVETKLSVQIFTQSSDSWREVKGISGYKMTPSCFVIVNGVLYLLAQHIGTNEINHCILQFNLCREEFLETLDLPSKSDKIIFSKWKESFAVVEPLPEELEYNVWIMTNGLSWTKLFKISGLSKISDDYDSKSYFVGTWKDELLFRKHVRAASDHDKKATYRELTLLDTIHHGDYMNNHRTIKKYGTKQFYFTSFDYVESLVPVEPH